MNWEPKTKSGKETLAQTEALEKRFAERLKAVQAISSLEDVKEYLIQEISREKLAAYMKLWLEKISQHMEEDF